MITATNLTRVKNLKHGFFGRREGVFSQGFSDSPLFMAKQVHGDTIVRVDANSAPAQVAFLEADAVWTTSAKLTVGIKTGDCAPLLLTTNDGTAAMAVHLGWKGAANGLASKAIRLLCGALAIPASDLVAAIGPCISYESFVVRNDVIAALQKSVPSEGLFKPINETQWKVDLQGWVERQLLNAGVVNIEKIARCTFLEADTFHSARRDAGNSGRQVSCIMID